MRLGVVSGRGAMICCVGVIDLVVVSSTCVSFANQYVFDL